jgi:hypothetical protein
MKKDLMLELWETRPKLIEKRNDETFEVTKEVVIGLSGTLEIEKKIRGVRIIKRQ